MRRRRFCVQALAAAALPIVGRGASVDTTLIDEAMRDLMARHSIPGGALGIARGGEIRYAKGFGLADVEKQQPVKSSTRFRIASLSKSFTAAAVLRLVEKGRLKLSDTPFPMLGLQALRGSPDPRLKDITVRHLLQHTGGWDKASGDPLFQSRAICEITGDPGPADVTSTIRYGMGRKLDFEPGTVYSYSNYGYCVLGALIRKITGQTYEEVIREEVLRPCGIEDMIVGSTLQRAENESCYYEDAPPVPSVFPSSPGLVPWPYGAFSLETNAANGGWIAHVEDLLRFAIALDESNPKPLLNASSMEALVAAPSFLPPDFAVIHYGLGWLVRPKGQGGRPNLWHRGSLPGTLSVLVRLGDGFDWVVLFNKRPPHWEAVSADVQDTIHKAAHQMKW